MCELLQCYCDYMLTAGTPNAAAPDVYLYLNIYICFISTESQVQYDLGPETYMFHHPN